MSVSRPMFAAVIAICLGLPCGAQQSPKPAPAKSEAPAQAKESDYPLDKLTEFSATMVGGLIGNVDETRIYRSGKLMRTDMLDGKSYMVTSLETYDTFAVMGDRCMHDAQPSLNTFPFTAFRSGNKIERNLVGTETVEGHPCQVEEVTITSELGKNLKLKFWEATDLSGFPVKLEVYRKTGSPVSITYKDVKIGPPDPTLFAHPANCGAAPDAKKPTPKKPAPSTKKKQ